MKLRTELPLSWRVRAGVVSLVLPPLILVVPLDKLTRRLGRRRIGKPAPTDQLAADWIDNLLHRLPPPWKHTCLRRCVVIYHELRRAGREVELCVGVRKDADGNLAAHAWLLLDNAPYLEPSSEPAEFRIIAKFPEKAA